jgi:phosphoserine phosphatase RsbU/P
LYLSGDFVNYFKINDIYSAFYMADVSGHGVSSALVTILLKSFINNAHELFEKNQSTQILNPAKLLNALNDEFLKDDLNKFSTIFYGVLNASENILSYCNGGHFPFPILTNSGKSTLLESKTSPVGITREVKYENISIELTKDFSLSIFSDGILDILPQDSLDEKIDFLSTLHSSGKEEYDDFITNLIENAVGLPDDITILSINQSNKNE